MRKRNGAGKPAPRLYVAKLPPLDNEAFRDRAARLITEDRREALARFAKPEDRLRSLGAGLLLRFAVKDAGLPADRIRTALSENGKPYLPDYPYFHFNLSHSGEYVICCVGSTEVGCDVEEMKRGGTDIARRFFLPSEYSYIMSADDENERTLRFYRLWTAKESFMKLTGLGLKMELSSFELRPNHEDGLELIQNYDNKTYSLQEFRTVAGYCITVCSELTEKFGYTACNLCDIAESEND